MIIPIVVAIVLILIGMCYFIKVHHCGGFDISSYHKWTELAISYLAFIAILVGGLFAYYKYDNYRRESNYQKVITRYLDNNIDVFTYEMSSYSMKVIFHLELIEQEGVLSKEEKKIAYLDIIKGSEKITNSLHKLMVFDPIVYKSYVRMISETSSASNLIIQEPLDHEKIKTRRLLVQNWSRFVIFNLQDIGELLRKNTYDYDTPNIEKIKEKKEYKKIINRFEKFIDLWDSMNKAKRSYESYKENNVDLQRSNPEKFKKEIDTKNDNWTKKTTELYNYVAEYLDEKGIPTSKAKED